MGSGTLRRARSVQDSRSARPTARNMKSADADERGTPALRVASLGLQAGSARRHTRPTPSRARTYAREVDATA
jgi:hypothetical protein